MKATLDCNVYPICNGYHLLYIPLKSVYYPTILGLSSTLTLEVALDHKGNVHLYQYTPHSDGREGDPTGLPVGTGGSWRRVRLRELIGFL